MSKIQSGLEMIQRLNEKEFYSISSDQFLVNADGSLDNASAFEWEYHMRREMQEIIPGVFLGPYASALRAKELQLKTTGITHIICVRQQIEAHFIRPHFPESISYLLLDIADSPVQNIIQYFGQVRNFIDHCLSTGGKILVHCDTGISRSAALVISYLMEKYSVSSADAIRHVQRKRFCIFPNEGFRRQLMEYEPIIRARKSLVFSPENGGTKRHWEEPDDMNDMNDMN